MRRVLRLLAMSVLATGAGPITYPWQKDGTNLTNGGTISGSYKVYATWPSSTNADSIVEHIVTHSGGSTSVIINQDNNTNPGGANNWNLPGEFRLLASSTYTVTQTNENHAVSSKILRADAVMWDLAAEAYVSVDLGTTNMTNGLTHPQFAGDGNTTPVDVGGRNCRRNLTPGPGYPKDLFFYFTVADNWAYRGSRPEVDITIDYYDAGTGRIQLEYDSSGFGLAHGGAYKYGGSVTLTGTDTWKQHTFHVTDAWFANRQQVGVVNGDFRIRQDSGYFYLDVVRVSGQAPSCGMDLVFPGASWQTKTPSELGLDEAKINQFASNLGGQGCIIRQGYMVKQWSSSTKGDWGSALKPVVSTMLLFAVQEGKLSSVHDKIRDWGWSLISKDQPMEFYHLANMTSGYARGEAPGAAWAYNDYAINLYVKTLFDRVFGTTPNAATTHSSRLGFLQFQDGSIFGSRGGYGVEASPRDFARIGWLWCNKGYWNGTQLLPQHYFDGYMTVHVPWSLPRTTIGGSDYLGVGTLGGGSDQNSVGPGIYGFNWWFNPGSYSWPDAPDDTFQALGHGGQEAVTVIPSLSLVVACRGNYGDYDPGNRNGGMNQNLKILVEACPPPCVPVGSIIVDPAHPAWFKYQDGGPFFMCGPGDPEGFLYRGSRNADGTRNGDQMTLINKMIGTGANCIYVMAVRSHGGDGGSLENPWIDGNINNSLDEDILNQWETWFTWMDNNGITIFFIFYDDSAAPFGRDVGSQLDSREANLIDTVVSRFKHHKHLIWCVAEEYAEALSTTHVSKIAERIKQWDSHHHPVAVHQNNGTSFDFNGNANLDQFAVQYNTSSTSALHAAAVAAWNNVGGLKNVNLAEFQPMPTGSDLRLKVWAIGMGGAYSMILFMDIASTPVSDLEICGRLVQFMKATRFNETRPYDSLARGNTDYVLADPGKVYIAYGDAGSSLGLNLQAATYSVQWYDPVDGDWVDEGVQSLPAGDRTFTKPGGISDEAALYLSSSGNVPSPADLDGDGDVDQEDFGVLQVCLSGEGYSYAAGCEKADLDSDGDVGGADLNVFLNCVGGANRPPGC